MQVALTFFLSFQERNFKYSSESPASGLPSETRGDYSGPEGGQGNRGDI